MNSSINGANKGFMETAAEEPAIGSPRFVLSISGKTAATTVRGAAGEDAVRGAADEDGLDVLGDCDGEAEDGEADESRRMRRHPSNYLFV
jgi:hypothetical protein